MWSRKAAIDGNPRAMFNLGKCYWGGEGVEADPSEAVRWFKKSAEAGYAQAQYNLGVCYLTGNGTSENPWEARKWFMRAAKQGYLKAHKYLSHDDLNSISQYLG